MSSTTSARSAPRTARIAPRLRLSHAFVAAAASASAALIVWTPSLSPVGGVLLVGVGTTACLLLLREERRGRGPSLESVLLAVTFVAVVAVVVPPRGSNDLWSYVMYGRTVVTHHTSPYTHVPADFPADPFLSRVSQGWRHTPSVYGPVFAGYAALGALVAGHSALVARLFHQLIAAGALAGILVMVWRRTRSPAALALLGLHPAIATVTLNGGHNDLLLGLLILGGVLLAADGRPKSAGLVFGAAILVKVTAGLALVGLVLWQLRRRGRRSAMRVAAPAAIVGVGGYLAAGSGALAAVGAHSGAMSRASAWQLPRSLLGLDTPGTRVLALSRSDALGLVTTLATLAVLVGGALLAWRVAGGDGPEQSALVATATYEMGGAYTLPWYAAWTLPLAALRPQSLLTKLLVIHAGFLAAAYRLPQGLPRVEWLPGAHFVVSYAAPFAMLTAFVVIMCARRPALPMTISSFG